MVRKNTDTKTNQSTILTNDPSISAWGWAIITHDGQVLECGCIKTAPEQKKRRIRKGDDTVRRITEINRQLLQVIRKYNVTYMLSELPHGSQSASAAVMIGIVTGIGQTLSDALEIGIEWYSEGDSKKCALGKLSASKGEMIEAMTKKYKVPWRGIKYIDEAVADALAVHNVARQQSSLLRFFNSNLKTK